NQLRLQDAGGPGVFNAVSGRHWPHEQGRRHHDPARPRGGWNHADQLDVELSYARPDPRPLGARAWRERPQPGRNGPLVRQDGTTTGRLA
nr:hypothetical protein [Tanacetum cinerariifolium]